VVVTRPVEDQSRGIRLPARVAIGRNAPRGLEQVAPGIEALDDRTPGSAPHLHFGEPDIATVDRACEADADGAGADRVEGLLRVHAAAVAGGAEVGVAAAGDLGPRGVGVLRFDHEGAGEVVAHGHEVDVVDGGGGGEGDADRGTAGDDADPAGAVGGGSDAVLELAAGVAGAAVVACGGEGVAGLLGLVGDGAGGDQCCDRPDAVLGVGAHAGIGAAAVAAEAHERVVGAALGIHCRRAACDGIAPFAEYGVAVVEVGGGDAGAGFGETAAGVVVGVGFVEGGGACLGERDQLIEAAPGVGGGLAAGAACRAVGGRA